MSNSCFKIPGGGAWWGGRRVGFGDAPLSITNGTIPFLGHISSTFLPMPIHFFGPPRGAEPFFSSICVLQIAVARREAPRLFLFRRSFPIRLFKRNRRAGALRYKLDVFGAFSALRLAFKSLPQ